MQAAEWDFRSARGRIAVREWHAAEPRYVVLLIHGYGEHAGRYEHVAQRLVESGATVLAHDQLGHGRSDGERVLVEDVDDLVADVRSLLEFARAKHEGLPVALIGHSMGGIVATLFAQRHPGSVGALVLSGPVIGGNPGFQALLAMDPIPEVPIDPATLSRDPAVGEAYAADPLVWHGAFKRQTLEALFSAIDAIADGPNLGPLPTLWIHGELDALAPLAQTRPAIERIRGEMLEERIYAGAQHEVFNEINRDEVLADVIGFLDGVLTRVSG
jgi:alpha-beta hydrolase superfamily lysophospholipase